MQKSVFPIRRFSYFVAITIRPKHIADFIEIIAIGGRYHVEREEIPFWEDEIGDRWLVGVAETLDEAMQIAWKDLEENR